MMNVQQVHIASMGINHTAISASMISDTISEGTSDEDQDFDDSDILNVTVGDEVTAQLVSAGPIGIAAAAAIATARKRKRPHIFETNPSVRKRQQTRLLRKLRATIEEYTTRVGQQAVVLSCTPGKMQHNNSFRVFGSQPLESILRGRRSDILGDLDIALAQQAPPQQADNPALHELPPLTIDGIPTPVDKMTQAQLRAFIPEMLKYSTGRSKPGWGKPEYRPIWWPDDVAWANVRSDVRSEEQKKKVSWTHALRQIVKNCYRHHNRDDLMPDFQEDSHQVPTVAAVSVHSVHFPHQPIVQTINNPDGTVSVIQIDTGDQSTPQVITLADGTQAQVVHTIPNGLHNIQEQNVQTLADVAASQNDVSLPAGVHQNQGVATLAEATINSEGQIILTADPNSLAATGMVTIPVSMYQSVVTSLTQLNEQNAQLTQQSITNHLTPNTTIQVITPGAMDEDEVVDEDVVDQTMDDEDIKPLVGQSLMEVSMPQNHTDVPDATQAVEVMSVETS